MIDIPEHKADGADFVAAERTDLNGGAAEIALPSSKFSVGDRLRFRPESAAFGDTHTYEVVDAEPEPNGGILVEQVDLRSETGEPVQHRFRVRQQDMMIA